MILTYLTLRHSNTWESVINEDLKNLTVLSLITSPFPNSKSD